MGNNVTAAVKTMNSMINMTGGSNNDKDSTGNSSILDRLPDGEKYFGFFNVNHSTC